MSDKYYQAKEKDIKLSDVIFDIDHNGNFYKYKLQGGWDIDECNQRYFKYLDQQDIEELGWTLNKNYHICEQEYSINIDDYSWYELNLSCGWDESIKDIEIEKFTIDGKLVGSLTHSKTLFKGKIRNYNELKLIMSMVGIK